MKKKSGIMVLEVLIVLIITASIMSLSLIAGKRALKSLDLTRIISESQNLSKAVIEFYQIKNYIPGDVPLADLTADLSTNPIPKNTITVNNECSTTQCTMGTGHVTGRKSILAFQQMSKVGLINMIDETVAVVTSDSSLYSSMKNKLIPSSKYNKNAAWLIGMDSISHTTKLSPQNSVLYNLELYKIFQSKPRLILFAASNYGYSDSIYREINVANTQSKFMGSGSVNANLANEVDIKIDDGIPNSGFVIGENDQGTNGFGCTDTSVSILSRKYLDSDSNLAKKSCIMTFLINL